MCPVAYRPRQRTNSRSLSDSPSQLKEGKMKLALSRKSKLEKVAHEIERLEIDLAKKRTRRNDLALELINIENMTLREVAKIAKVSNPYLAQLNKKRETNVAS